MLRALPPVERKALFRDPYVCLMREDHPACATFTRKKFVEASHVLVTYRGGEDPSRTASTKR